MSFPGRNLQRCWHLVDAKNQTVGRLAQQIASILKGKHKPTFQPNKDMGDTVVVINAEKVRRTDYMVEKTNTEAFPTSSQHHSCCCFCSSLSLGQLYRQQVGKEAL